MEELVVFEGYLGFIAIILCHCLTEVYSFYSLFKRRSGEIKREKERLHSSSPSKVFGVIKIQIKNKGQAN